MLSRPSTQAVVLDIGGVLMDWDPRHLFTRVIEDVEQREWFLTHVCSPEWNLRQDQGRSWEEAVAAAVAEHPAHETWIRAFDERWIETVRGLFPETVEIVREVKRRGVPLYALTNFSAGKWAVASEHFEALRAFDGAVVSGEEKVTKPDPAIYRLLVERFALDPPRTFFTDDVQSNVDAAREAGLDAHLYTGAARLRAQLADRRVLERRER